MKKDKLSVKIEKSHDGKKLSVSDINIANNILQTIPDLVFITSNKGDIYYVKADSADELAFPVDEILGKNLADLPFTNEQLKLFLSSINKCASEGLPVNFRYKLEFPNLTGYYDARAIPFESDNVMVIIRNSTTEEEARQSLIEREKLLNEANEQLLSERNKYISLNAEYEKTNNYLTIKKQEVETLLNQNLYNERILNQILDNSPSGIFTFGPDLRVTMLNTMLLQTFMAKEKEMIGQNLCDIIGNDQIIESLRLALEGKYGFFQGWYYSKRTDQSLFIQIKSFPLYDDEIPDKIIGGTGIVSNLTDWKQTSDKLLEREENLLVTLKSIGDGVIVTDDHGIVNMINPVAQKLTGFTNNEAITKNINEIFVLYNSDTGEKAVCCIKQVINTGNVFNLKQKHYIVSVSGEKYQISVSASPIRNKENTITGVVIVFQDITESHKLFQRIALSETRQKALVQNSPLGVLLIHENGQILDVNQSAVRLLGSPSSEATKKINVLNFEPLEKAGFKTDFLNCLNSNSQIEAERHYITKWGKEIYVRYFFNPIILPDNEEKGVLCSLIDITEQKLAEKREIIYTNSLKHLSDTAISFVELAETEDPFTIIGNKLCELTSLPFVLMRRSDDGLFYEIVQHRLPQNINEMFQKSGIDLRSLSIPTSIVHNRNISRYFQRIKPDFEKFLNEYWNNLTVFYQSIAPSEIYTIDFIWEEKDFGNATFFLPSDDAMNNVQVIETFVNQASLLLQKRETAIRLRQSNDLYLTSINAIADYFYILDPDLNFIFINRAFQKFIFPLTRDMDITGKNLFEVFPILGDKIKSSYKKILDTLMPEFNIYDFKVRKRLMFIEANSVPIIENGILKYIITTFRDITSQTRYENQIKELKEFNEKIIESIKDGIAVINDDNEVIFTNPAFDRLLGLKNEAIIGKRWTDFIADIPVDDFSSPLLYERSSLVRTEVTFKSGDSDVLNAMITISPAVREKNTYILLVTDITERKKMEFDILKAKEKAEESDRLKTAFLSNMSHEIRTPLNSIIGFSYLLQKREIPHDKQRVYLNHINSSSQMLLRLIQDIIDISKIEAGQLSIEESVFDLKDLMAELIQHLTDEIATHGKDIELRCLNKEIPLLFKSDYIRIKQVMTNLLNNALKFTDKGLIEFGYKVDNDTIRFFVKDTGIGIKKEDKKILFHRFSRVSNKYDTGSRGTGLGLAICKNIVELMGGKIEFDSVYKKGTTFIFSLPYSDVSDQLSQKNLVTRQIEITARPPENMTILIAEDDDVNYMFIQEFLSEYNIKIIRAVNGEEAIEYFRSNPGIALILMDLQMPMMDGIEATRKIREIDKKVPILAQTAYAFSSERKACLEAGCNDYITKPIVQNELLDKIISYTSLNKNAR